MDGNPFGEKSLLPVPGVLTDHVTKAAFINRTQASESGSGWCISLISINNSKLILERELGVWNHGRK